MIRKEQNIIRCAIYTRKSCEDGLEQDFNSLDAQRLAGENYVASQIHENWRLISKHYDDGGFSGGNMNRPALKELFADIEAGLVDMVVVYKIDRLSRSLFDFSKIVEHFDKHNVSFVSVTQSFNTSNSSGKLMLNILLSFAQFERELSGERIRDKFAASLKKGMWMGGNPPLGYNVENRSLVINDEEAKTVKFIYEKFLETESYFAVTDWLNNSGYRTKIRQLTNGKTIGGGKFQKNTVLHILKNPYYKGCVTHKDQVYPGQHEAIIDEETWGRVQNVFANHEESRAKSCCSRNFMAPSFLKGIIRCESCDTVMIPTHCVKKGVRYRYYTCQKHLKFKSCDSSFKTVPAGPVEEQVVNEVVRILKSPEILMHIDKLAEENKEITREDVIDALQNLNEVWNYLYPVEQRKIVKMLVTSVLIQNNGLKLNLNLDGLNRLLIELS